MQNLTSLTQNSSGNITCSKNFTVTGTTTLTGAVTQVSPTELQGTLTLTSGDNLIITKGYFTLGSSANTSGSGYALTSSLTKAIGAYADDNGTLYGAGAVRTAVFRNLITLSHSNETSIFGSQSQLKMKPVASTTLTTGNRGGSWNYLEMAGTADTTITLSGTDKATCGAFAMVDWDGVGSLTLSSGHYLAAVAALTNVTSSGGTFTQTGKFCAFVALNNSTTSYTKFRYGLYLPMSAVVEGIRIADSANTDGSGIPLSATYTSAMRVHADTGSVALEASNTRAAIFRYLIGTAPTASGNTSTYGAQCQLKIVANSNVTGNQGGVCGYLETSGSITLTGSINAPKAGVISYVDIPSGVTIAAGTFVAAFGVNACDLGGTHTGATTVFQIANPSAGGWDYFAAFSTNLGNMIASNTHSIDSHALSYILKVYDPAGNAGYIPIFAAVPS